MRVLGAKLRWGQSKRQEEAMNTKRSAFMLIMMLLILGGNAAAQQNAPDDSKAETEPLAAPTQSPRNQLKLNYEEYFASGPVPDLTEEISIDLLDIDAIRLAIEAQPSYQVLRLSLQEVIQMALERNNDIIIAGIDSQATEADIRAAKGEFDPTLQANYRFTESNASASQQIRVFGRVSTLQNLRATSSAGVAGKLHTGTLYNLSLNVNRERTTFGGFEPDHDATLAFTLTQPLLRGLGLKVNRVRIKQARNTQRISAAQFQLTLMTVIGDLIKAYWDHVGTIESLHVQTVALKNAERLLKINETRYQLDAAAKIDILQAKGGVAARQSDLIAARSLVEDAGDLLKLTMDLDEDGRFSGARIVPLDRPNLEAIGPFDANKYEADRIISVDRALLYRPEMRMTRIEIENARLSELSTKNALLPQLDFVGSLSTGGRDRHLDQTFQGLQDRQDDAYSYGVQASVPLGNRTARGNHQRAMNTTRRAEQRAHQTLRTLESNVHRAARAVMTNQILVESNTQARRMQEVNVVAEETRMQLGVTTSFQVLQVQEQLTTALTQELQARIAYEKARVDLQVAEGTLLKNFGIDLEPPEDLGPIGYFRSVVPERASFTPHWE